MCASPQADTEEIKNIWAQDIWDLFFSHMLQLKGTYKYTGPFYLYGVHIC